MKKIFTYHKITDGEGWFNADAYDDKHIEAITDPQGGSETFLPTAIPSPFARLDLVKTAFRNAAKSPDLKSYSKDGDSIVSREDEKLVSDALDLAELLFNIDSIKDDVKIITWDKEKELVKLLNSSREHKALAEALSLYMEEDKDSYNFDSVKRLYFIEYDHKIIGTTSPVTLFCASANDLTFAQIKLTTDDILFDDKYAPLYSRDPEFQLFLYHLFVANPLLKVRCKYFYNYLQRNLSLLERLNHNLYNQINTLNPADFVNVYDTLGAGSDSEVVEIFGTPLRKRKKENILIAVKESDFIIKTSKFTGDNKPIVLESGNRLAHLRYINGNWNTNTSVPSYDAEYNIEKRRLPGQVVQYPFLTVSDFLEPHLIRLVYPINKAKFFDGNLVDAQKGFLLPLKKAFFNYFNTDDLLSLRFGDKPMFEMYQGAVDSVKVILRIPIGKGLDFVQLERLYYPNLQALDLVRNKGVIIENQFGVTVYPFYKTGSDENSFYRIMLVDRDTLPDTKNNNYQLSFFKNFNNQVVNIKDKKTRSNKETDTATTEFYVLEKEFDYIEVKHNTASGIIIPIFKNVSEGSDSFTFAVDFGTTNTHIEYMVNSGPAKSFEIGDSADDIQIATLHDPQVEIDDISLGGTRANALIELIPQEFVPRQIGKSFEFSFPQRTAISENNNLNFNTASYSLADFNIPFVYEKYAKIKNSRIATNLKWSNYTLFDEDRKRLEAYFENLLLLIRNKILLNGGKLDSTKLIWFYPSSMMTVRRNKMETTWKELYSKYITTKNLPVKLSESVAPFYFFNKKGGVPASHLPVAAIDIGGGTTDIVIFRNNQPELLTSFRFAANTIFGDAFNGSPSINGFVQRYFSRIEKLLDDNQQRDLVRVLKDISEGQRSEDIITFFFSIENNKKIKEQNIPISFNKILADDDEMKIVFIVFYCAIIYHLAKVMKAKELPAPRYITFSGTGSKVINVADDSIGLSSLKKITKLIFEAVYNSDINNIDLIQHLKPKEITCKGGLLSETDVDIDDIKVTLLGGKIDVLISGIEMKYIDIEGDEIFNSVLYEVESFIDLVFSLNNKFNFTSNFGINPSLIDKYKETLKEDLMEYLKSGKNLKLKELQGNTSINIEETFFFYPLVGALNRLAYKIESEFKTMYQDV